MNKILISTVLFFSICFGSTKINYLKEYVGFYLESERFERFVENNFHKVYEDYEESVQLNRTQKQQLKNYALSSINVDALTSQAKNIIIQDYFDSNVNEFESFISSQLFLKLTYVYDIFSVEIEEVLLKQFSLLVGLQIRLILLEQEE